MPSGYGDLTLGATRYDPAVRRSTEFKFAYDEDATVVPSILPAPSRIDGGPQAEATDTWNQGRAKLEEVGPNSDSVRVRPESLSQSPCMKSLHGAVCAALFGSGPDGRVSVAPWVAETFVRPFKVSVHRPGDHFVAHVDTPRPGVLATVVCLDGSSAFEGGELQVHHEGSTLILGAAASASRAPSLSQDGQQPLVRFAAFFPNLVHQVEVVTSGVRVSAVFDLAMRLPHERGTGRNKPLGSEFESNFETEADGDVPPQPWAGEEDLRGTEIEPLYKRYPVADTPTAMRAAILSTLTEPRATSELYVAHVRRLVALCSGPGTEAVRTVGVVASHKYSYDEVAMGVLKGSDRDVGTALAAAGFTGRPTLVPVVVRVSESADTISAQNDYFLSAKVYRMTREDLMAALAASETQSDSELEALDFPVIVPAFVQTQATGVLEVEGAERVGNEYRSSELDCRYWQCLVVGHKPRDADAGHGHGPGSGH